MAGAEQIRLQQFEVASIAAPPALLCQQLLHTSSGQGADALAQVLQNPALLLRVLDAHYRLRDSQQSQPLTQRVERLDGEWLHAILSDMALQLVLRGAKGNHLFHQLYWQDTRRTALIARALAAASGIKDLARVELCASLLDCGKLMLEQKHGAAWAGLHLEIAQPARLLEAERQTLGIDHIEAGVALLRGWQLEQDCIDALRYQAVSLDEILDATPLVRVAWLARLLAGLRPQAQASAYDAAQQLFGLGSSAIDTLLQESSDSFERELRSASLHLLQDRQPSDAMQQRFEQEVREELQRLQWQMLSESALLALENIDVSAADGLAGAVARALQHAAVEPRFILLGTQPGSSALHFVAANKLDNVPEELGLQLVAGRSALADLVLAGELALLDARHEHLAVIDRQLLDLMGGSLLCESVSTAAGHLVLLLAASPQYPQRRLVRAFIKRKLAAFHAGTRTAAPKAGNMDELLYRQRVREAIHEANNPLAIIKNYLQILHMKLGDAGGAKEIGIINTEIDRVAGILAGLREQQAQAPAQAQDVDLNSLLRSMHKVFAQAYSAPPPVDIRLDLADGPVQVQGRADALKQIITNLVMNAAEALEQGGNIVLSTRRNVYQNGTLYLQLCVADNGPGMQPARLATVFNAGNSTKGGNHSGSGLAIVKRLVDELAGQVSCQSDSKGTAISILLPQQP